MPSSQKRAVRRMTIEVSEEGSQALARRQIAEGLNPTTLYERAIVMYDEVMQLVEELPEGVPASVMVTVDKTEPE